MKKENITTITLEEVIGRKGEGKTDWERLRREEETGIEPEQDFDEGTFDWSKTQVTMPRPKQPISVRLDADVIEFFKAQQGLSDTH